MNIKRWLPVCFVLLFSALCIADDKPKAKFHAQFGPDVVSDGYRVLCVYTKEELTDVQYKWDGIDGWSSIPAGKVADWFGYMTSSYIPTNENRKYLVRGTRKDGSRVTDLLTVKAGEKGPVIETTGHLEETKETVAKESAPATAGRATGGVSTQGVAYTNTLASAQRSIGSPVGNGGCNALAGCGGETIGTVSHGGRITGTIVPGSILEIRGFTIRGSDGAIWSSPKNLHYAVVESYDPATSAVTILHQNTAGGAAQGQRVRRDVWMLNSLSGSITVRAGN